MEKIKLARIKAAAGERLTLADALALYEDNDLLFLAKCARRMKEAKSGKKVFYTVNRHINLTNICSANCPLCAFQVKDGDKRGFVLETDDVERILDSAKELKNLSEIHIVSALHPDKDFAYYKNIVRQVRAALPEAYQQDEELLKELGHYWYADRELAKFVKMVKEQYPDSLIVVVGDHADRYNIDKQPVMYERYGIPFIVTGKGVHKGTLAKDAAGSQIDIVPTIMELVAPKGHPYLALGTSLTLGNNRGVNYGFWMTRQGIGKADTVPLVSEDLGGAPGPEIDQQAMQDYINAIRSISWYLPKYGPILDAEKIRDR